MEYFCRIRPHEVIRRYKSIYSNLQKFLSTVPKITKPHYSITDYTYPSEIRDWFEKETHEQTLVVVGKSGYGKTEGMIALLQPFNPILIKHLEKLRDFTDMNKAAIFDDIRWENVDRETILGLTDKKRKYPLRILYDSKIIPPNIIKVILLNKNTINPNNDEAIARRIKVVTLTEPLININIINNITNITNIVNINNPKID
jgi:hypothetical protein